MKHLFGFLILTAMAVAAEPVPTGYWSFDEGTGTNISDKSGSGLNGWTTTTWGPGKIGKALVLSGSNKNYASIPLPTNKQPGKSSYTFSCWLNPTTYDIDSKQKQRRFLGFDRWPFFFVVGDLQGDGKINLYTGYRADTNSPATASGSATQKAIPLNQWTHVALVSDREAGKLRVYLNGVLDVEASPSKEYLEKADIRGDRVLTVGSSWQSFAGSVDELKYFKKALTADEIKALAAAK